MAFDVWVELVCATCSKTTAGRHTYSGVPRAQMMADAAEKGWKRGGYKNEEIFCSALCKAAYENQLT